MSPSPLGPRLVQLNLVRVRQSRDPNASKASSVLSELNQFFVAHFRVNRKTSYKYQDRHTLMCHTLKLWSDFVMQETAQKYHRRSRRINIGQPVKLIPSLPRGEFFFEEIETTSNVSREGFYFLTK